MESKSWKKYTLLGINVLIMVYALVALIIDSVYFVEIQICTDLLGGVLFVVPGLTIGICLVAILLAVLGCVVALKKSYCLGITFCVMASVVFLIETLGGVTFYVLYILDLYNYVEDTMFSTRLDYATGGSTVMRWDAIQRQFECCGVRRMQDWSEVLLGGNQTPYYLPMSCCPPLDGDIGTASCNVFSLNVNKNSCLSEVGRYLMDNTAASGYTLIGLVVLQIASIVFASIFTHPLRSRW